MLPLNSKFVSHSSWTIQVVVTSVVLAVVLRVLQAHFHQTGCCLAGFEEDGSHCASLIVLVFNQFELLVGFVWNVEFVSRLSFQVQVNVIKHTLWTQIHALHRNALEDKLGSLANEEFANGQELLLCECLAPIIDFTRCVGKAGNLKEFSVVFDFWCAVQAFLIQFQLIHWLFTLLPHTLVHVGWLLCVEVWKKNWQSFFGFTVVTFHHTLQEVSFLLAFTTWSELGSLEQTLFKVLQVLLSRFNYFNILSWIQPCGWSRCSYGRTI